MTDYINCSCHRKYINSDESIAANFGFNRLQERYRTCVKCRQSGKQCREKRIQQDPEHVDKKRERNKQWHIDYKGRAAVTNKIYNEKYTAIYDK